MKDKHGDDERAALTRSVLEVLDAWEITREDQCRLLGMTASDAGRRWRRYRLGTPLPDDPEIWIRVAGLLRLANALRQIFPHSAPSANLWVTTPRAKFGNQTPLELMLDGGTEAISRVERSLDNLDLF